MRMFCAVGSSACLTRSSPPATDLARSYEGGYYQDIDRAYNRGPLAELLVP